MHIPSNYQVFLDAMHFTSNRTKFQSICGFCKLKAINILEFSNKGKMHWEKEWFSVNVLKPVPANPWGFIFHLRTVYFPLNQSKMHSGWAECSPLNPKCLNPVAVNFRVSGAEANQVDTAKCRQSLSQKHHLASLYPNISAFFGWSCNRLLKTSLTGIPSNALAFPRRIILRDVWDNLTRCFHSRQCVSHCAQEISSSLEYKYHIR